MCHSEGGYWWQGRLYMFGCRVLYRVSAISTQFCSDSGIALKSKVYYTTMGKNVKRHLTKENIQIARKQLLKNSTLHVIKEFHLKTRMRYQQIYENCENPKYPYTAAESWCLPSFSEIPIRMAFPSVLWVRQDN